jgi:hypothetical protein
MQPTENADAVPTEHSFIVAGAIVIAVGCRTKSQIIWLP